MKTCEWCSLSEEDRKWLLLRSVHWSVYLADVQDYIGRCIVVLSRHCGSLSELTMPEWIELKKIINKLELCYRDILGAELCNWSCLMNNFYKDENPDPHLHIHVRPRYRQPVRINQANYMDAEFGHHYATKKENQVCDEDKYTLYRMMAGYFSSFEL